MCFDVTTAKCYNCGKVGHISKDCKDPRKRKKVAYKGRKYFLLDAGSSNSSDNIHNYLESEFSSSDDEDAN